MIQILPAIDMIGGNCVRLSKGDYDTEVRYHDNPVEMAIQFEEAGSEYIHLVDLDAAKGQGSNLDVVLEIAKKTNLIVQAGGGVRNEEVLKKMFDNGVHRAIIGSLAVKNPNLVAEWIAKYGSEKIVIGTDVHNEYIATDGWYETSTYRVFDFIADYKKVGGSIFLCTDIAKDGMLQGTSEALYSRIMAAHPDINLIASGGVAHMQDIINVDKLGMYGVVVGKAIYEGKISLEELFSLKDQ